MFLSFWVFFLIDWYLLLLDISCDWNWWYQKCFASETETYSITYLEDDCWLIDDMIFFDVCLFFLTAFRWRKEIYKPDRDPRFLIWFLSIEPTHSLHFLISFPFTFIFLCLCSLIKSLFFCASTSNLCSLVHCSSLVFFVYIVIILDF